MVGDTDQLIVGAVLGQHKPSIIDTVNAASKDVMLATQKDLLKSADGRQEGRGRRLRRRRPRRYRTPVVATEDVAAVGWPGLTVTLEADGRRAGRCRTTAPAGTHVGTLTVGEGASQVKVPVALQSDLTEPAFGEKLTRVG